MSQVNGFWGKVDAGGSLSDELDALMSNSTDVPAGEIVALGAKHGFVFEADELRASLSSAAGQELSDAELEGVAGGAVFAKYDGVDGEAVAGKIQVISRTSYKFITPRTNSIISF